MGRCELCPECLDLRPDPLLWSRPWCAPHQCNYLVNEKNDPFRQRICLHPFDVLDDAPENLRDMTSAHDDCTAILSCLMPDMADLIYRPGGRGTPGQLDIEAIIDCQEWVGQACKATSARNPDTGGLLLYYALLHEGLCQFDTESIAATLDHVVRSAARQHYEATKNTDLVLSFLLAVHKARTVHSRPDVAENKSIFWHNFRTNQLPATAQTQAYYAFNLTKLLPVLAETVDVRIDETELRKAVANAPFFMIASCPFYDLQNQAWENLMIMDPDNAYGRIPLPESQLHSKNTKRDNRALYVTQAYYNKVIEETVETCKLKVDYTQIEIKSKALQYNDGKPYNFYDHVVNKKCWFGWRALEHHAFADYCGYHATVSLDTETRRFDLDSTIAREHEAATGATVEESLDPVTIFRNLNPDTYTWKCAYDSLPPALKHMPFNLHPALIDCRDPELRGGQESVDEMHLDEGSSPLKPSPQNGVTPKTGAAGGLDAHHKKVPLLLLLPQPSPLPADHSCSPLARRNGASIMTTWAWATTRTRARRSSPTT